MACGPQFTDRGGELGQNAARCADKERNENEKIHPTKKWHPPNQGRDVRSGSGCVAGGHEHSRAGSSGKTG
jgi:hypothetical protein